MKTLTAERLRELLHYDPDTGVFTWRQRSSIRCLVGAVAGSVVRRTGYRRISVDGKQYQAHRLAVLYVTGNWPAAEVDHGNGVRGDNRWGNLRQCTAAENRQNMALRRDNSSGFPGVTWSQRDQRWVSQIKVGGKNITLGRYEDASVAYAAYCAAKAQHHQFAPVVPLRHAAYAA